MLYLMELNCYENKLQYFKKESIPQLLYVFPIGTVLRNKIATKRYSS
jgi:hypothetical protein